MEPHAATEPAPTAPAAGRWASLPLVRLIAGAVGLAVGISLGAQYGFLDSSPWTGLIPPSAGPLFSQVAAVGVAGLLGLILLIPEFTHPAGVVLLVFTGGALVGWPAGTTLGPRWQPERVVPGRITIQLTGPAAAPFEGSAECVTEANGDRIVGVGANALFAIGVDRLGLVLGLRPGPTYATIELPVNGRAGYAGTLVIDAAAAGNVSGQGAFWGLKPDRFRIGGWSTGPPGVLAVSGTLSWHCGPLSSARPVATPGTEPASSLQGWFVLHGIVEMAHPCSGDGPCLPYGYATGVCTRALDLRTDALETVVPWIDGRRARLRVVPGRDTATLTVQRDDGSPAETVAARATLVEHLAGVSRIRGRTLTADFQLAQGRLSLTVDWECGDNFERPLAGQRPASTTKPAATAEPAAGGLLVEASSATSDGRPALAFDGDSNTTWNAGTRPRAWVQARLPAAGALSSIRLTTSQLPAGRTVHQVWVGESEMSLRMVHEFAGETVDDQTLSVTFPTPELNVRLVRIVTTASPSWVAWREIALVTR